MRLKASAVLLSLITIIAFSTTSAAAATGPEFLLSEPTTGPAPFVRSAPSIASNGSAFLLVWHDGRERNRSVRAARVNAAGTVLDPLGLVLWRQADDYGFGGGRTVVASDGRDYLAAYECGAGSLNRICVSRVSAEGVVSAAGFVAHGSTPALAWNGRVFALLYHAAVRGQVTLFARQLAADATPIGQQVEVGPGYVNDVAGAGDGFLITSSTADRIQGRLLSAGNALGPIHEIGEGSWTSTSAIAAAGNEFFVTWNRGTSIQSRFIGADGVPRDVPRALLVNAPLEVFWPEAVALNGGFVVVYGLRGNGAPAGGIFSLRVNADGSTSGPVREASGPGNERIQIASGDVPMLSWLAYSDELMRLEGAQILARPLAAGRPSLVSWSAPSQHEPHAAVSGASTLVTWIEPFGDMRTGTLFVVSTATPRRYRIEGRSANQSFARLSGGDAPMIFWIEENELRGKRLEPWGQPIDATPIAIAQKATSVAAVPAGDLHFVFYSVDRSVYLKRVNRAGQILDTTPILVATSPENTPRLTSAATDGGGAMIAWNAIGPVFCTCSPTITAEYAVVSREGALLAGPRQLVLGSVGNPQAVWNGSEYVAFGENNLPIIPFPQPKALYAQRVRADGSLLDETPKPIMESLAVLSSIAWNGSEYLSVLTGDLRTSQPMKLDRISRDLRLISSESLQTSGELQSAPFVVARPGRSTLVVYEKNTLEVPYLGVSRITGRHIDAPSRIRAARR